MLPNHSSLVVAEQFGTLVALHGDRIDLGLGPRAGHRPAHLLGAAPDVGDETVDDFPNQVIELLAWFGTIQPLENGIGSHVVAMPGLGDSPELWLLGSSDFSAQLAGMIGLPFAFAHHFAGGDNTPRRVRGLPRDLHAVGRAARAALDGRGRHTRRGRRGRGRAPRAPQQAHASCGCAQGARPSRIPTLAEAEAYDWTDAERAFVAERNAQQAIGDLAHVRPRIDDLAAATGADEVIVVPQGPDLATKLRTLRALGDRAERRDQLSPRRSSSGSMSASRPRKSRYASSGSFEPPTPSSRWRKRSPFSRVRPPFSLNHSTVSASSTSLQM